MTDLRVEIVEQQDSRLGRQLVHDPRSRAFAFPAGEPLRRDFTHRIYQPYPNPNQPIGNCTGVDVCVKSNAVGNRVMGQVLDMDDAIRIYSRATEIDPWEGNYPPIDSGSSALAASKAAVEQGLASRYEWIFTGADGVLAALQHRPVGIGAWWYDTLFNVDPQTGLVELGNGRRVGGHQWTVIGYRKKFSAFVGLCWWNGWGNKGRFLIRHNDLDTLLQDGGDASVLYRTGT